MKKLILLISVIVFSGMLIQAQDTVTMKNGNIYTGKVQVVSTEYIQIIDGGTLNQVPKSGIKFVRFKNSGNDALYVDRIDINGFDIEFIQIIGTQVGGMFQTDKEVVVQIDYGQKRKKYYWKNPQLIANNLGQVVKFNSMIDALNYLTKHGWEFVSANPMSSSMGTAYHWLLRKQDYFGQNAKN